MYFPVSVDPAKWDSLASSQLPCVGSEGRAVFKALQPWYWDEQARSHGVDIDVASAARRHPLYKLHDLARRDRHRVPQPVLARAGNSWLEAPEGITVESVAGSPPPWTPGEPFLTWHINPVGRVNDVHAAGEAILAFSEESARWHLSALDELQEMRDSVAQALRTIEIEVLQVITQAQMSELNELQQRLEAAQNALRSVLESPHVIDQGYIDDYSKASNEVASARQQYTGRWRELFE